MSDPTDVTARDSLPDATDDYFQATYRISLQDLLAPVADGDIAVGEDLRGSALFRHIEEARKADDPRLPLGPWERELKRADWPMVGKASVQALIQRSKDLQLAAWVLESGLHCHGLAALAPGLDLLRELCERYWDGLFPAAPDGDLDYRTNLFRWIDDKFPALLAVLPLTQAADEDGGRTLGDWRRANLPDDDGRHDGARQEAFLAALAVTPGTHLAARTREVREARRALDALDACLDERCGEQAPGFGRLAAILDEIEALVGMELEQRGDVAGPKPAGDDAPPLAEKTERSLDPGPAGIARRQEAYALLAQAADYLMQTDPHSPVPYLVRQAIAWGRMDTRALYRELFLEQGGQINVFHLLGLEPGERAA